MQEEEEEAAAPSALPHLPRHAPLDPLRSVMVTDPDGGARVLMREDLVLHVTYPDGSTLLQVRSWPTCIETFYGQVQNQ